MRRKIYLVFCIIFGLVFIVSSAGAGMTIYRYRQADKLYDDLEDTYVVPDAVQTQTEEKQEKAPFSVDFESLSKENSDVIGWLYSEDTPINYPVVQSKDNDYYLHRDLHGEYLFNGTLFADCRCSAVGTNQIHIIYGHNMKNSAMFGTLSNYSEQRYYDEHPVLYYLTPDGDYRIELFSGFTTEADSDIYKTEVGNAEEFEVFLEEMKAKSTFDSGIEVTGEDHIVMLSTCSYEFNNARYVVFGKLTPLYSQS